MFFGEIRKISVLFICIKCLIWRYPVFPGVIVITRLHCILNKENIGPLGTLRFSSLSDGNLWYHYFMELFP